jgi:hypothetical protein
MSREPTRWERASQIPVSFTYEQHRPANIHRVLLRHHVPLRVSDIRVDS